jgi:hypothetical protein
MSNSKSNKKKQSNITSGTGTHLSEEQKNDFYKKSNPTVSDLQKENQIADLKSELNKMVNNNEITRYELDTILSDTTKLFTFDAKIQYLTTRIQDAKTTQQTQQTQQPGGGKPRKSNKRPISKLKRKTRKNNRRTIMQRLMRR